jgi:hypothetical protein
MFVCLLSFETLLRMPAASSQLLKRLFFGKCVVWLLWTVDLWVRPKSSVSAALSSPTYVAAAGFRTKRKVPYRHTVS